MNKLHTSWSSPHNAEMDSTSATPEEQKCFFDPNTKQFRLFNQTFERVCIIAAGRFGRVLLLRGKDRPTERYAAKVMSKALIVRKRQVQHVRQEIEILNNTSHPFIVKMAASFLDSRKCYIVMELMAGGDLFNLLNKCESFSEERASFYVVQVCLALEYLHERSIAYRDIKPENVLLDMCGYVKLGDFGFARRWTDKMYTICGTLAYTAPEVLRNQGYDSAVDWWSLGILTYEMCSGSVPFDSHDSYKTQQMVMNAKVEYPEEFSSDLQDILRLLLQRDVSRRYTDGCDKVAGGGLTQHPWLIRWNVNKLKSRMIAAPWLPDSDIEESGSYEFDDDDEIAASDNNNNNNTEYEDCFREFYGT